MPMHAISCNKNKDFLIQLLKISTQYQYQSSEFEQKPDHDPIVTIL